MNFYLDGDVDIRAREEFRVVDRLMRRAGRKQDDWSGLGVFRAGRAAKEAAFYRAHGRRMTTFRAVAYADVGEMFKKHSDAIACIVNDEVPSGHAWILDMSGMKGRRR